MTRGLSCGCTGSCPHSIYAEQIQALAQGADERRKQPAVPDDLAVLAALLTGGSDASADSEMDAKGEQR